VAVSKLGETAPELQSGNPTPNAARSGPSPFDKLISEFDPELQKAFAAARDNNLVLADSLLRTFLQAHPKDVNALKLLAEIAWNRCDYAAAHTLYGKCVELAPDFTAARHSYAKLLVELGRLGPAKAQLDELLRRDSKNLNYRSMMAYTLGQVGDYADALHYHRDVLQEAAHEPRAWMVYANDLRAAGAKSDCIAAYRRVIELEPAFAEAYWNLSNLKTFRFSRPEIDAMRAQLASSDLTVRNRCLLHFSLGKALEDDEQYENAFDNFRRGNALHRSTIDYDADQTTKEFERLKTVFTQEFFGQRARTGCAANDPIFIVGLPRSGSTLVEQILSSHSAIEGTRELPHIQAIAGRLAGRFPDSLSGMSAGAFGAMGETYLEETRIFRRLGRPHFTDKMPSNFAYAGFIQLILPNAKIVDVRRHPLDCCVANFKQIFSRAFRFSYSLTDLGGYYRNYVDLMEYFDDVLPGKIHRINYEQLVESSETEIQRLLDYLGLPFEQRCLSFYENDRAVRTASSEQVRMPIFKDAIGSWRKYEFALEPLKSALGSVLDLYPAVTEPAA
jgi:tetratricopeptide (TPR) repeat protein